MLRTLSSSLLCVGEKVRFQGTEGGQRGACDVGGQNETRGVDDVPVAHVLLLLLSICTPRGKDLSRRRTKFSDNHRRRRRRRQRAIRYSPPNPPFEEDTVRRQPGPVRVAAVIASPITESQNPESRPGLVWSSRTLPSSLTGRRGWSRILATGSRWTGRIGNSWNSTTMVQLLVEEEKKKISVPTLDIVRFSRRGTSTASDVKGYI